MITTAKRCRKNKKQLAIKNLLDKTAIVEIAKVLSVIDFDSKYS